MLPKYRFQIVSNEEKPSIGAGKMVPTETSSGYLANERILLPEDAVSYLLWSFHNFNTLFFHQNAVTIFVEKLLRFAVCLFCYICVLIYVEFAHICRYGYKKWKKEN